MNKCFRCTCVVFLVVVRVKNSVCVYWFPVDISCNKAIFSCGQSVQRSELFFSFFCYCESEDVAKRLCQRSVSVFLVVCVMYYWLVPQFIPYRCSLLWHSQDFPQRSREFVCLYCLC